MAKAPPGTTTELHELLRCRICDVLMFAVIFMWGMLAGVCIRG